MKTTAPTIRERQHAAADVLADLTARDLPEAEWRIALDGVLHGHVHLPGQDAAARAAVTVWARQVGAPVIARPKDNDRAAWVELTADGHVGDVPVQVWTHISLRPLTPGGSK